MTVVAKYVGNGEFINGVAARDLTDEDWAVIGRQGRQQWVIDSPLYELLVDVAYPPGDEPEPMISVDKTIDAALAEAGFLLLEAVNRADDETLLAVSGIGPAGLRKIRQAIATHYSSQIERVE